MSPKDYIAARQGAVATNDDGFAVVDGRPYFPLLKANANDETSVKRVVACLLLGFHANDNGHQWKDYLEVEEVKGGITNALFHVSGLQKCLSNASRMDPGQDAVLVRIFGAEGMIDRDVETATYAALWQAGLAPTYYGRFSNGRLEAWLDGMRPLDERKQELAVPEISRKIAIQLARFHATFHVRGTPLEAYHSPDDPSMWQQLFAWMERASEATFQTNHDTQRAQALPLPQIPDELAWLRSSVIPIDATTAFCHNDTLAGNILYNDETHELKLIDYEYGGINYVSFDIANHFNEYAGGNDDGQPNYQWFPSPEHQKMFIRTYLEETQRAQQQQSTDDMTTKPIAVTDEQVDQMYDEVQAFVLANCLYWSLWAVNQASAEGCQGFDYLLFAKNRLGRYFEMKGQLQQQHEQPAPAS